jgi:hypothetical protein
MIARQAYRAMLITPSRSAAITAIYGNMRKAMTRANGPRPWCRLKHMRWDRQRRSDHAGAAKGGSSAAGGVPATAGYGILKLTGS